MPFAGYKDFQDCLNKNKDKDDPAAYCASIHKKATGKWPSEEVYKMKKKEENVLGQKNPDGTGPQYQEEPVKKKPFSEELYSSGYFDDSFQEDNYPWDICIADQEANGVSNELATKICAVIKNRTVKHLLEMGVCKTTEQAIQKVRKDLEGNPTTNYLASKLIVDPVVGDEKPSIPEEDDEEKIFKEEDLQVCEALPPNAKSVKDPSQVPKGWSVVKGPKGGIYAVSPKGGQQPGGDGDEGNNSGRGEYSLEAPLSHYPENIQDDLLDKAEDDYGKHFDQLDDEDKQKVIDEVQDESEDGDKIPTSDDLNFSPEEVDELKGIIKANKGADPEEYADFASDELGKRVEPYDLEIIKDDMESEKPQDRPEPRKKEIKGYYQIDGMRYEVWE